MSLPNTVQSIRFGYGCGPRAVGQSSETLIKTLTKPGTRQIYPYSSLEAGLNLAREIIDVRGQMRDGKSGAAAEYERLQAKARKGFGSVLTASLARIADSQNPFQDRLQWFWADHFTAVAKQLPTRGLIGSYLDDAIGAHVGGRFPDMLKAVVTHPLMLTYLDQFSSVGPNSRVGKRRGVGLNENLAREVLELHTLGVGGGYTQDDVGQLAALMTGLTLNSEKGFEFRPAISEPGTKTILGKTYGGTRPRLGHVFAALEDIALRPETAAHLATKLYTHFVSNEPNPLLIEKMAAEYLRSDGELIPMYQTLIEDENSKRPTFRSAKRPFEYISSAIVALGMTGDQIIQLSSKEQIGLFWRPLQAMGQPFLSPPGPDGWSEDPKAWITPQGLATRISWSIAVANLIQNRIDDPRAFLETTLGDQAGQNLTAAVAAAEDRATGIALVLASSEFNRR